MDIEPLIAKLEAATEGSRELDAEIVALLNNAIVKPYPPSTDFGPRDHWQFWSLDEKHFLGSEAKFPVYRYTTSLDAALTLVPEGWFVPTMGERRTPIVYVGDQHRPVGWFARVNNTTNGGSLKCGDAKSLPVALCIAALKARQ